MGGGRLRSDSPRRRASRPLAAAVAACHGRVAADAGFRPSSHRFAIDTAPKWRVESSSLSVRWLTHAHNGSGLGTLRYAPVHGFRCWRWLVDLPVPAREAGDLDPDTRGAPAHRCEFLETAGYNPAFRGAVPFGCYVIWAGDAVAATEISE